MLSAGTIDYTGPDIGPGGMDGWMGTNVWYLGVSESNDDTASRFGAPTISGDVLDFNPQNFEASASGGSSEIVDSQLNFMIVAKGANRIDSVTFSEAGDTTLFAFPPDLAFTSVTAFVFIDVVELDGAPVPGGPINLNGTLTFSPSDGDFLTGVDGSPNVSESWTGIGVFDLETLMAAEGVIKGEDYVFGATKVNFAIDNTLTAGTSGGASAFIRKKDADGFTITTDIPEPTTVVLAALGLLTISAAGRRR